MNSCVSPIATPLRGMCWLVRLRARSATVQMALAHLPQLAFERRQTIDGTIASTTDGPGVASA